MEVKSVGAEAGAGIDPDLKGSHDELSDVLSVFPLITVFRKDVRMVY